ncbi:hypothetical protein ARMSODRAFT_980455 [Armillaria solidipes]|uniref:Uncharacterized protein n=1 Tax=Armillaria solidipes TaxID=1076256 RepID=A0A2H3BIE0_9AGAR|nr:hypothetical protein ARMSODRAFT_980455 [Armillaria solidipes]
MPPTDEGQKGRANGRRASSEPFAHDHFIFHGHYLAMIPLFQDVGLSRIAARGCTRQDRPSSHSWESVMNTRSTSPPRTSECIEAIMFVHDVDSARSRTRFFNAGHSGMKLDDIGGVKEKNSNSEHGYREIDDIDYAHKRSVILTALNTTYNLIITRPRMMWYLAYGMQRRGS